jgi:hypothetical protein
LRDKLSGKRIFYLALSLFAFVVGPLGLGGCTHTPNTYTMKPQKVERIRSNLGTVGVTVSDYKAEAEISLPGRGVLGGAGRGFVMGATIPVMVGAASPIPGGTVIGILFVPIGAVVGTFYGAAKAAPAEEVDKAKETANRTVEKLRAMDLRLTLQNEVIQQGSERTGFNIVPLSGVGPQDAKEVVQYDQLQIPGIDTVLELRMERGGLWGLYTVKPPSSAFVEIRAQLIRVSDNEVLLDDVVFCASEERSYKKWSEDEGQLFLESIISCIPSLAEKVVDDFFLVYPLAAQK